MIEEALKFLADQAKSGMEPKIVHQGRTAKQVLVANQIVDVVRDYPPREHVVGTLSDLVALANRFNDDCEIMPVVWYDRERVGLTINDDDYRDDKVVLKLTESQLFKTITDLNPRLWYDPKLFVRLLRVELHGALDAQTLLVPVQRVKFENGATTRVENTRNRESLGREITSSVKTEVEFPEFVYLQAPVYTTPGIDTVVSIKAAVEVDPSRGEFQLAVLPDEIEKAVNHVMSKLGEYLAANLDDGIHFYQGSDS